MSHSIVIAETLTTVVNYKCTVFITAFCGEDVNVGMCSDF